MDCESIQRRRIGAEGRRLASVHRSLPDAVDADLGAGKGKDRRHASATADGVVNESSGMRIKKPSGETGVVDFDFLEHGHSLASVSNEGSN
ncbi:hypothetical protein ACQP0C_22400 [Nocardia sp. CA-129566]|uniref:hypothetical protein n=1 Tax=Nocardia sp. CA-129566 TaxID=3239976 RepID=UPI003D9589FE